MDLFAHIVNRGSITCRWEDWDHLQGLTPGSGARVGVARPPHTHTLSLSANQGARTPLFLEGLNRGGRPLPTPCRTHRVKLSVSTQNHPLTSWSCCGVKPMPFFLSFHSEDRFFFSEIPCETFVCVLKRCVIALVLEAQGCFQFQRHREWRGGAPIGGPCRLVFCQKVPKCCRS